MQSRLETSAQRAKQIKHRSNRSAPLKTVDDFRAERPAQSPAHPIVQELAIRWPSGKSCCP